MVYEDLDAGDESRRNGDTIGYPHPDGEGTALDSVTIPQGAPVTYDGTDLAESTATGDDMVGILANYNVYGDTGQEEVKANANVRTRGAVIADLTDFAPTVGTYLDDNSTIWVNEQIGSSDLYEVFVR